jgi:hypothetical protein
MGVFMGSVAEMTTSGARHRAVTPARSVPIAVERELIARAAGRCELRGCNRFLYAHPVTGESANFGENAHIIAFSERGPRGAEGMRPADIHDVENLMLLCAACHKLVDCNPKRYTRAELQAQKREHKARINRVTEVGPDVQTTVLLLKARIGGSAVEIAQEEIVDAVHPRYPAGDPVIIDLTGLGDEKDGARYQAAAEAIAEQSARLYANGSGLQRTKHLSVFALAPIPLLVALGGALSNKITTDFYQCHRGKVRRWTWFEGKSPVRYALRRLRQGSDGTRAGLVLSVSGIVDPGSLPEAIDARFSLYEITLQGQVPNTGFLRQRGDLDAFRETYRGLLARLRRDHPGLRELHVFPAVPAPVAVACGFDLLPKVDPALVVYDNVTKDGGFIARLKVNDHERK